MWKLDIGSSSWSLLAKEDKSDDTKPIPMAFNSFASFKVSGGTMLVFATFGGLEGKYDASRSFSEDATSVSNSGRFMVWDANAESIEWYRTLVYHPQECCDDSDYSGPTAETECRKAGYWGRLGCSPSPRAMHTATWGVFVSGVESLLIFGGVGQRGEALQDMWYCSLRDSDLAFGSRLYLKLGDVSPLSTWPEDKESVLADLKRIVVKVIQDGNAALGQDVSWFALDLYDFLYDTASTSDQITDFTFRMVSRKVSCGNHCEGESNVTEPNFAYLFQSMGGAMGPALWSSSRDSVALTTTVFSNSTLTCDPKSGCLGPPTDAMSDVAFQYQKYDDQQSCNPEDDGAKCMRGELSVYLRELLNVCM